MPKRICAHAGTDHGACPTDGTPLIERSNGRLPEEVSYRNYAICETCGVTDHTVDRGTY